jgi:TP901 family phage tail tape measure protein
MADDIQSNIKINVDTTSAMDSIRLLQNQISAFHQQMSKMGAASAADSRNMQQNLINSINATGAFTANMTKVRTTAEQFSLSLEKNKLSMGEYFRYAGGATKTFGKLFQSEFETINKVARERVKDLQSQYIKLGRDANGAMQAIKVRPLVLDMQNLGTKTQIAAQRQQLLNQLLKQGSTNLLNFGKNTQWAGRQLMVGFTIPLSIMGSAAMRAYKDIEEAGIRLKRVYGDLGTTNMETEKMVKQVQQLALEFTKYGVAVKDSMDMAATAAATGKQGAELLAQVSSAAKLAVLGGVDQQKALQTTISLTDAFGVSTKQLAKDINFLNAVENQTVLSIDDMTTAIPKAAPVIQQLGGDVKDLAFFLTAMKEGGINASEGANAIKSGLASLINPTNSASKMLQGFGINLKGIVQGNKGDVKKTVIDFAKALDQLDPLNRAKAIEQLFGKFQFARMSTLFKNVIEQGSQASEVLRLASKSALELSMLSQKELNKIQQSPLYKFQKAIADFQAQLAPVGEQFMKALTPIINFGTDVLKNFNNLGEGAKGFIVKFVAIAGVVGPVLLMSFGLIANAVANVIKGFALMKDIFNKTGKSSMSLGDQVNYMTNEQIQAAAIASSLDQVHSKLKQTFTSEAAAVDMLTAAYQRSVAAQRGFAVPITPRGPAGKGPIKKYAAGGIINGPGTGTSDSILAMVSNGEAIIPAASVARNPEMVRQLVSGKIPGFAKGKTSGTQFAHVDENVASIAAGDLLDRLIEAQNNGVKVQKNLLDHLNGVVTDLGRDFRVRGYHGLGFTQSSKLNVGMRGNAAVSTEEFLKDFELRGAEKWNRSIKLGGGNIKDLEIQQHLKQYDQEIIKNIKAYSQMAHGATITSEQFSLIEKKARESLPGLSKLKTALTSAESGLFEIRNNIKQSTANAAGISMSKGPSSTGVGLASKASGRFSTGTWLREGGNRFTTNSPGAIGLINIEQIAEKSAITSMTAMNTGIISGIKKSTKQRSPSKEAELAGENIGIGAIQGINSTVDDAKRAGTQVGTAAAQGVTQSGRVPGQGGNRVSSDGNMIFLPGQGYVSEGQIAKDQALANAPMQSPKQSRLQKLRSGMNAEAIYRRIQGADQEKLSTGIRNRAFGASGALAIGSMVVPGEAGQMMGMASMLSSFAGMGSGGIAKGLKAMSPNVLKIGFAVAKRLPYIGIVLTAFEAFDTLVIPMIRKNADSFNAISDTLNITKDKIDKINNFFGTEIKLTGIRAVTVAEGGQSAAQATVAQQFQQSQEFKDVYKESAEKLKGLTDKEFERAMQMFAVDLFGQGMEAELVTAIIDAIAIEAKKTRVSIAPELFSLENPETKQLMNRNIQSIFNDSSKLINELNGQFAASGTGNILEAATGQYDNFWLSPYLADPQDIAKIKAAASEVGSYISALGGQYQSATISAKEYNIQFDKLFALSKNSPDTGWLDVIKAGIMQLDPILGAAIAKLNRLQTKAVIGAINAGVTPTADSYEVLQYGTEEQRQEQAQNYTNALKEKQALDAKVRVEQANLAKLQNAGKQIEKTEQKINDKYDKRIAQIEKIKKLNEQIARSQEGQLTLAEALNRGDVAAAARAAIDIQKNDVQDALENQKTGLDEARKAEVSPLKQETENNTNAINSLTSKIQTLIDTGVTVKDVPGAAAKIITPEEVIAQMGVPDWLKPAANFLITKELIDTVGAMFGIQTNANGGYIRGAGTGTSDDIPAMLSNGEYVIRANAVKTIGVNTLDKLNQADRLGFAAGGIVDKFKKKKPKPPKPKPYTLEDLAKPITREDDPDWYDYTHNFFEGTGMPFFLSKHKWSDANQGFYRGQDPSSQRGVKDILDIEDGKVSFTSVAGAIKYYKALILSRRQAPGYIKTILGDRYWTGYGDKQGTARANSIYNRMFGNYNGLDKAEAKVLASAMTRLWGKDSVKAGFKTLGLSPDLLTNKRMFKDWDVPGQKAWDSYTRNNDEFIPPLLPANTPKYAMGGLVGYAKGGMVGCPCGTPGCPGCSKGYAMGGMVRHFKGGGYNGYADGGFVGPRPAPQWDEKGRWVVSRGESYWSTAESTLPGGMTIGPWWSRILKSNIDPETGKERRLYRNSRIWIPGSKQPYPPKIGIPRTINEKKPLYMGGMPFRGIGENHLGFMGVGGFGIMKQYADGGLVGYKDGGKSKKSRGYPAAFNVTSGVGKGQAERNKLYKQGGFQGFEAGFNSWMQGIMNDPVSGTILKKVGEGIEANPFLNFALSTLSLPVNLIGGAVNASMYAGQALAKGDLFGAATAGLRGTGDAFASTYGNMFSKMIGDDAVYRPQFEVAAQTAYDMNLFNAQNDPEIAALGRIIGGTASLAADPLNYVGIGLAAKAAKLGSIGKNIKTSLGVRGAKNALRAAAVSTGADVSQVGKLTPTIAFNLSDEALQGVIKDNFYGNMRVPGMKSSTKDSLENRIAVEQSMMGISPNAPASKTPAYGFLTTRESVPSYYNSEMGGQGPRSAAQQAIDDFNLLINSNSRFTNFYGSNTIKLKPDALGRATVSMGDSLSIWDKATRLGQKIPGVDKLSSIFSTFPAMSGVLGATQKLLRTEIRGISSPTRFPYIEAHLPGGFTLDDIESIMLNPSKRFGPQDAAEVAADLAQRRAVLEAMFESMGIKGIKITENEGIKIGDEALEEFKKSGGKIHEYGMANYPLPTKGSRTPRTNPFAGLFTNPFKKPQKPILYDTMFGPKTKGQHFDELNIDGAARERGGAELLNADELHYLTQYVAKPYGLHGHTFGYAKDKVINAILRNKFKIDKGTEIVRVANVHDMNLFKDMKPGQTRVLDQFLSVANKNHPSTQNFIDDMMGGKIDTGGRGSGNYPLIKFNVKTDIPGINDINNIKSGLSDVSDGLLAPGTSLKLVKVTSSNGKLTYHVDLGTNIKAKYGLNQKGTVDYYKNLSDSLPAGHKYKNEMLQNALEIKTKPMDNSRMLDFIRSQGGRYANGGMVKAAGGGLMINGQITGGYNMGGMVQKFVNGGYAMGTDTVPAMLTPGEFVIKKSAVDRIGPSALNKINGYAEGGLVGGSSVAAVGDSVYNNNAYEINVNVRSDANPDQIARAVMTQIRQIDNHRIRGV